MRLLLITTFLLAITFTATAGERRAFDYASQLGVAEVNEDGEGCLTIVNSDLLKGEIIKVVNLDAAPTKIMDMTIEDKLTSSCSRNPISPKGCSFYSFKTEAYFSPSIAIARFHGDVKIMNGKAQGDLDRDGKFETFRECTSPEGVHLTVWAGEPLKTRRLWHQYFYLGYDIEPSCTGRDYTD